MTLTLVSFSIGKSIDGLKLIVSQLARERYNMKNSKKWLLAAVLIVTALVVAGQRSFADSMATLYNPAGMNQVFAGLSGGSFSGDIADYQRELPGTFSANGTQIYYLSANPGSVTQPYPYNSFLSILVNDGPTIVNGFDYGNYNWETSSYGTWALREINFGTGANGMLSFKMSITDRFFEADYFSSNPALNSLDPGINHFIYYDVTSLLSGLATGSFAYLVGYEDMSLSNGRNHGMYGYPDFYEADYTDALFLVITSSAGQDTSTPEPATMFLWTLGGLSMAGASWRRNRNKKKLLA